LLKRLALTALNHPTLARYLASAREGRFAVFMLHRFASSDGSNAAHDTTALDQLLRTLRQSGVRFVSLDEMVAGLTGMAPTPRGPAVAFTVDDCYPDLAEVGLPLFTAHDCPVTGFVVPDVVDGTCWFWWDQVQFILKHANSRSLRVELPDGPATVGWTNDATRIEAGRSFTDRLKALQADELELGVRALAAVADVPLSRNPPSEYRVLDWDQLRTLEASGGIRFGAHSLTHPLLSRCSDARAAREIEGSVTRVRSELRHPSQLFAYPVGRACDFGPREEALVAATGLLGAVTAEPGRLIVPTPGSARWRIPRFAHDERPGAAARLLLL